jgi:hypothetical protein
MVLFMQVTMLDSRLSAKDIIFLRLIDLVIGGDVAAGD